jgi:hypothetical protein
MKCEFIKADGTSCKTFAIRGTEPPRCIFHSPKSVLKEVVYTPVRDLNDRIRLLKKRLNQLRNIRDEAVRSRLTLDIISKLETLEAQLKAETVPKALSTAERLKGWKS